MVRRDRCKPCCTVCPRLGNDRRNSESAGDLDDIFGRFSVARHWRSPRRPDMRFQLIHPIYQLGRVEMMHQKHSIRLYQQSCELYLGRPFFHPGNAVRPSMY